MGYWVVSVSGIAILSVLCDVILPEGEMRKYIKTIFGIVVALVIIQPIIALFSGDITFKYAEEDADIQTQQQFLQSVDARQREYEISALKQALIADGIDVRNIKTNSADGILSVEVNEPYSLAHEQAIKRITQSIASKYKIKIVWK